MLYLFIFGVSLATTFILTPLFRNLLVKRGWVDHPDQARKLHRSPVPRLGGLPIAIAFFTSLLLLQLVPATLSQVFQREAANVYKILLPSLLVLFIGVWDDLRGASPMAKIAFQVVAAYWLYAQGLTIQQIGVPGTAGIELGVLSLPITILWVVGVTNALNLVDGLDGLASGVAFFAATTMFAVALIQKNIPLAILTASLSGAAMGFLRYNFNPATVFLGDSGSMFLGFLLSAFAIIWTSKTSTLVAVVAPLFALGLPIAEVGISVVRRFVKGQGVFTPDREHIHHRLLHLGLTPRRAVLVLYGVCALLSIASLLLANWQTRETGLILLVLVGAAWMGIQQLGYHEFGEVTGSIRRGLFQQRHMINAHVRMRRLAEGFRQTQNWQELTALLREVGHELGFHAFQIDLRGRTGRLPPDAAAVEWHSCNGDPETVRLHPERYWRVDIPVGGAPGDHSRMIFSRPVAAGATPYLVSVLVEVVSSSLPETLDRLASTTTVDRRAAAFKAQQA